MILLRAGRLSRCSDSLPGPTAALRPCRPRLAPLLQTDRESYWTVPIAAEGAGTQAPSSSASNIKRVHRVFSDVVNGLGADLKHKNVKIG